mgnify:CR=1 FL=1
MVTETMHTASPPYSRSRTCALTSTHSSDIAPADAGATTITATVHFQREVEPVTKQ